MAEKDTITSPSTTNTAVLSSPATPSAKHAIMSSPETSTKAEPKQEEKVESEQPQVKEIQQAQSSQNTETESATAAPQELPPVEERVEIDDGASDSGVGTDYSSDTTSIAFSMMQGYLENGRHYQGLREGEYWAPCDEKQLESNMASHLICKILDSEQTNPLFRSPIGKNPQNILDVGTGDGEWAREVADRYASASVVGIDLHPPPDPWVPPNCKLEVDDALKEWIYPQKFDLIHMRDLYGSFSEKQWKGVYKQAYNNLLPGGWIEQVEPGISCHSDDGTLPPDSHLAQWRPRFTPLCDKMGKPINVIDTIKSSIEAAGFINVQEKWYKVPLGDWAKNPVHKEAGRLCKRQFLDGMEGYAMFVLTKFGEPEPWQPEEVQVFLAEVRKEIETPGMHAYYLKRRVWGQKPPLEGQKKTDNSQA